MSDLKDKVEEAARQMANGNPMKDFLDKDEVEEWLDESIETIDDQAERIAELEAENATVNRRRKEEGQFYDSSTEEIQEESLKKRKEEAEFYEKRIKELEAERDEWHGKFEWAADKLAQQNEYIEKILNEMNDESGVNYV